MVTRLTGQLKATAACIALASGLMFSNAAFAEQVTLKSADGTVNLVGDFVDFTDDNFIIMTPLGELRISASRVRCEGAACPQFGSETVSADVEIAGSDTIGLGMMPLLMTGFAASMDADAELKNTGAGQTLATLIGDGGFGEEIGSYLVSATNDNDAFTALLEGSAEVGMSSRRITKEEAQALRAAGAGNMVSPKQERIVAVDSMVVITHPSNEVDHLTIDQLRGVFSGRITNWRQLGGPDRDINVIGRPDDSASYDYFMSYLFGEQVPNHLPQAIGQDDQQVSNTVYLDRNAIGYVGYAFQRGAQPVTLVNECGIASTPDAFSAKTEEYDMSRRMYLYSRADNLDGSSQAFLDYAISNEADGVIGKSGFIDLGILRRAQDLTDERVTALSTEASSYGVGFEGDVIREMLGEMTNYDRLSTTLRFRTGSSRLDERGMLDLQRMVDYLENQPAGTAINFVGFTDDVGAFEANRRLSFERANSVLQEVRQFAGDRLDHIDMSSNGYGEVAASACNITDRGKSINRRVEVWISNDSAT
ncbi:phosphate ABC transporter substrate-binding/OmpA family protein [Rhodobacteraceae bacterium]|nr:phosphate ABC transporter substrate-binding/OmpA family protein [Paracoccaceae bacterium]